MAVYIKHIKYKSDFRQYCGVLNYTAIGVWDIIIKRHLIMFDILLFWLLKPCKQGNVGNENENADNECNVLLICMLRKCIHCRRM